MPRGKSGKIKTQTVVIEFKPASVQLCLSEGKKWKERTRLKLAIWNKYDGTEKKQVTFWFLFTLQCFIHVSLSFLHFFEMYDDSWLHAMDVKRYWVRICRPLRQWRLNKNKEKRLVTSKANYEFNFTFESKENVLWIINGKRKKEWYVLKQTKYCGSSVDRTWLRDSFLAPIVGWLV